MAKRSETPARLDDAARAGWLYYVAGRTQDEIAAAMGISRQSAQRLVSLAVAERLIKVRLDHPIAACLELGSQLRRKFGLKHVEVVPSDPASSSTTVGIAEAAAAEIERWLKRAEPIVLAIGTGRTLKAAVDQLPAIECPNHRIVSLTGNIAPDGSAAYYNVIFSMADAVKARHYPMPLPVLVTSAEERELLHGQQLVRSTLNMSAQADVTFVGIGELGIDGPLCVDGFLEKDEMMELMRGGCRRNLRLDLRCRRQVDRQPDQRARRVGADPVPRRIDGHRAGQGQAQIQGDQGCRCRPSNQCFDHR